MKFQPAFASAILIAASGVVNASPVINFPNLEKRDVTINPPQNQLGYWKCGQQTVRAEAIIEAAKAAVRAEPNPIRSEGNTPYPHEFRNDGASIRFPRCTGPFMEFPYKAWRTPFTGGRPGPMRVVLQIHSGGDNGSADFCGLMIHDMEGDEEDEFALCYHE